MCVCVWREGKTWGRLGDYMYYFNLLRKESCLFFLKGETKAARTRNWSSIGILFYDHDIFDMIYIYSHLVILGCSIKLFINGYAEKGYIVQI